MALATTEPLTIVLTLKDRSAFTYRWMRYMNDARCPYPILIADGGEDQQLEAHLSQADNYPHLHYSYIRYPPDTDHGIYYQKFADVVARVATPYVLLADNDDFFLLEPIPRFIRFLDADASFVSCGGTPIVLRLLSSDGTGVGAPTARQYRAVADERPKAVTADGSVDRLCYFMTNVQRHYLWSSWYQVHRAPAVSRAAALVRAHAFTDPVAFEIHMHLALLMTGKYQHIDVPFLIAQSGTSQLTAALNDRGNLVERFIMRNSFDDVDRSLESCAPGLSAADRERIYKAVSRWFAGEASKLFPATPAVVEAAHDPIERLYRATRRLLRPLAASLRRPPTSRRAMRVPAIERHILDPVP